MNGQDECRKTCWMIAGGVGLLLLIILWWPGSLGFFGALIWAVIVGLIVGFVLPIYRCRDAAETQVAAPSIAPTPPVPAVEAEPAVAPEPAEAPEPAAAPVTAPAVSGGGSKPDMLSEPRGGAGDDLTKIKGVGAKMQASLNAAGVWHFDQIAGWTPDEVAWADENLVAFKGRVSRDDWVGQAKALA